VASQLGESQRTLDRGEFVGPGLAAGRVGADDGDEVAPGVDAAGDGRDRAVEQRRAEQDLRVTRQSRLYLAELPVGVPVRARCASPSPGSSQQLVGESAAMPTRWPDAVRLA
jgi:hypothetical protein